MTASVPHQPHSNISRICHSQLHASLHLGAHIGRTHLEDCGAVAAADACNVVACDTSTVDPLCVCVVRARCNNPHPLSFLSCKVKPDSGYLEFRKTEPEEPQTSGLKLLACFTQTVFWVFFEQQYTTPSYFKHPRILGPLVLAGDKTQKSFHWHCVCEAGP